MNPSPEPTASSESIVRLRETFKSAMVAVRRLRGRETQRPGQLSYAQYSLLFTLTETGELPSTDLARAADLAPATVTQMLDYLESAGLVVRSRSDRDKRQVLVSLTDRGKLTANDRREIMEARWKDALNGFSDVELNAATVVIERMVELFDGLLDRQPPDSTLQS